MVLHFDHLDKRQEPSNSCDVAGKEELEELGGLVVGFHSFDVASSALL
eukprot:SAG31_NODE_1065_length_10096_cov_7.151530_4_plen_48_part_00